MQSRQEGLDSWKEIAAYLRRDVRTVQRWGRSEGLPVHRRTHKSLASVYAFPHEIDGWLDGKRAAAASHPPAPPTGGVGIGRVPKSVRIAALAAVAALALLATLVPLRDHNGSKAAPVVLVADPDDRSGDSSAGASVRSLLQPNLVAAGFNVIPRSRIFETLRLMRRDPNTAADETVAREIWARDPAIQSILLVRIERSGRQYVIQASLLDPREEHFLTAATGQAGEVADLPRTIRELAEDLRRGLAKPRRDPSTTLERVTTASLKALQLYSQAVRAAQNDETESWKDLSAQAIAADPEFASAHLWLAWVLWNVENSDASARTGVWRNHLERALH